MSHDRGCFCGREKWEYDECDRAGCTKKGMKMVEEVKRKEADIYDEVARLQKASMMKLIQDIKYRYREDDIVRDIKAHLDKTYGQHYNSEELQCFDAWLALGSSTTTARDTAIKYLWRYGKKNGRNKEDLMKAIHFIVFMLYSDFYRKPSITGVDICNGKSTATLSDGTVKGID